VGGNEFTKGHASLDGTKILFLQVHLGRTDQRTGVSSTGNI